MIVFHIAYIDNTPVVWTERPPEEKPADRPKRSKARTSPRQSSTTGRTKLSPYDGGKDGVNILCESFQKDRWSAAQIGSAIAWLPTVGGSPVPSSPLIGQAPEKNATPAIHAFEVTTAQLSVRQVLDLLCRIDERQTLAGGAVPGNDVRFMHTVIRFAGSLVARQQYLPGITQTTDAWKAHWQPVFIGADKDRFIYLAKHLPPALYALSPKPTKLSLPPSHDSFLLNILAGFVDVIVRSALGPADEPGASRGRSRRKQPFDSNHSQWLHGLRSVDWEIDGKPEALAELSSQIAAWRLPLDRSSESRYRLCFRLHEPERPEATTDIRARKNLSDDTWRVEYLLQPHHDPSLLVPVEKLWKEKTSAIAGIQSRDACEYMLFALGQAGRISDRIAETLKRPTPSGYEIDSTGAYEFLTQQAAALEQSGFRLLLPSWWTRKGTKLRLTAHAEVRSPAMKSKGKLTLDTIVTFNWKAAIGDELLTAEELAQLARLKTPLVHLRGQWVELNADEIRAAIDFWEKNNTGTATVKEIIRMKLGAGQPIHGMTFTGVTADGWVGDLLKELDGGATFEELPTPTAFSGTLRPYQVRGYSWMARMKRWGFGICLADDMGLGKTVQALAMIQRDRADGERRPVLLICPTSVVNNWRKEAARFTPDLPVMVHHGLTRKKGREFHQEANTSAIVISTFSLLHRDRNILEAMDWGGVVVDEAQNIKNAATKQAQAARVMNAPYRIVLTGTPVENSVGDLWSIVEFLNPGFLGSQAEFKRSFFIPIHTGSDPDAAERLRKITGPFILRRLKTDKSIIADLPEKLEMKVYCTLTKEQASLYESVVKDVEELIASSEGIERKGLILATLTKLKQVCNHPAHFLGDNSAIPSRSGKVARLAEMLEETAAAGDKTLVFTQFAEMGALLKKHLQETFGREMFFLHGGVARKQRDEMVERFQNEDDASPAFILSLKAGGTGLNLTRASRVIHFDRWWNPAVENQATDRAFRIGQTRNVQVHKFICAGTLEERIDEMIERKKAVAEP